MATPEPIEARTTVLTLLDIYGLTPSPEEIDWLVGSYRDKRAMAAMLEAIPDVAEPAVVFEPRTLR